MGCASSKRVDVAAGALTVYRPPPTSFAVFNVDAIEAPWIKAMEDQNNQYGKPTNVADPLLEKLNAIEDAPRSWDEVSKALEDLKPSLQNPPPPTPPTAAMEHPAGDDSEENAAAQPLGKSFSFHTLEELEAKLKPKPAQEKKPEVKKPVLSSIKKHEINRKVNSDETPALAPAPLKEGYKPLKENPFLLRDRLEREKEGKTAPIVRFNPLSDFPEICPPGGEDAVVIYTTSLGGVRRTFEDCNKVRTILEWHQAVFDERNVSLHGGFLNELKDLLEDGGGGGGGGGAVPRMFIKGRYIGGAEEVVELNETGRLGRILKWARVERGVGRMGCEGCGGARFVPCLDCGGSCKVVVGKGKEKQRCPSCNENGLVLCPLCD